MAEKKFELASEEWFVELFRLFHEVARANPDLEFSVCEVFTAVPERLRPDSDGKIAWHGFIRGGKADLAMGEVGPEAVDVKTVIDWQSTLPLARMKIDLTDPQAFAHYMELGDRLAAEGRMERFGDRTKAPPALIGVHNTLADRTA